jgi:hypothetical protein
MEKIMMRHFKLAVPLLVVLGSLLSGCVVYEPAPYYYHHPHYYYWR